jgi:DNA (cytosine-5)-methyltransferase 1
LRFAWAARPRVIMLENVKEFSKWGPLSRTGRPIKSREGETFDRWISQLQGMGYQIEWRNIKACDHGAPTIRDRLFMIARRDGLPIVWPEPTHGPGRIPYRTAAEVIDWSTPARSIFGRKKPLAEKTLERIAKGLRKFVIEAETPFYLNRNDKHCAPYFTKFYGTATGARIDEPLHTLTAGGGHKFGIVQPELSAFIIKHFGGMVGVDARTPFPTILTRGTQNQVLTAELSPNDLAKLTPEQIARAEKCAAFIIRYNGKNTGQTLREPLGAGTTKPRFALVVVKGNARIITDISMRMLTPREMFTAQGFPLDYVIDRTADGKPITLTDQYVLVGNSVSPPVARALVAANVTDSQAQDRAAA